MLHNRTILYYRENGANRGDILALGDWLILGALITDLTSAASRLGRMIADEQWQIQSETPTSVLTISPPKFLERFHEESETPLELLHHLWEIKCNESISVAATAAFEQRIGDLQNDSQNQFISLWNSRVALKTSCYSTGLNTLPASPIKDQLSQLLSTHVLQDLMLNTIKRARMKGLIRTPNLSKQVGRLEAEIAPTMDVRKTSPQELISRFAKKISLESPTTAQLATAKREHLDDMLAAMSKDKDGPRLFLSLVIILCASKREGIIYATGKFAPKLLRTVKDDLDEESYKRIEEIKELVKSGKVDKAVRTEMREIAAKAVKELPGENVEEEEVTTGGKAVNARWQTIYGEGSDISLKTAGEPLIGSVQNDTIWGENGEGWISKKQGHESKIGPESEQS